MLYGKITPTAKIAKQSNSIDATILEALYICAFARPYGLGVDKVNFEVILGNIVNDAQGNPQKFDRLSTTNVVLEGEDLNTWGNDDTVILDTIAKKLNVVASDFVTLVEANRQF